MKYMTKIAGPQSSLTFYAAYNTTDATTGTLQYVDGMTIFYCDGLHDNYGIILDYNLESRLSRLDQIVIV